MINIVDLRNETVNILLKNEKFLTKNDAIILRKYKQYLLNNDKIDNELCFCSYNQILEYKLQISILLLSKNDNILNDKI